MGNVSAPGVVSGSSGGGRAVTGLAGAASVGDVVDLIVAGRSRVAAAQAALDVLCVEYAELRGEDLDADLGPVSGRPRGAARTEGFVAAELSLVLRCRTRDVSMMLARTRRVRASLPAVAEAARRGELDGLRVARIDRAARMVVEPHTLALLDDQVVPAARERTLEQLSSWLDRFLARHEPEQLAERHRRGMLERRVTAAQAMNGMAYVTGEVSAVDGAAIDLRLSSLAQACGAADPRTMQQRRSDMFAGVLLGRVVVAQPGPVTLLSDDRQRADDRSADHEGHPDPSGDPKTAPVDLLEVEIIDPDSGEFLGTSWRQVDADGEVLEAPVPHVEPGFPGPRPLVGQASGVPFTVGVVVTVDALVGDSDTPAELWDRRASIPAATARLVAAQPGTLFARLLTDSAGRLLDVTELGRFPSDKLGFAVRARSATCVFPTCETPASRCDLDHHEPVPRGPTSAGNLGPLCRPHHNAKTFAWLACRRVDDGYLWTTATAGSYRCLDEPFPTEYPPDEMTVADSTADGIRTTEAA